MERLICVVIGYLFGLVQTGYIYAKLMKHEDIRKHGSGNAGTTNVLRTFGWKAGVITFLGDCLKCVAAVLVVKLIFGQSHAFIELLEIYAAFGVVLGHNFPFYLNFKGGKGIAATAGFMLAVNPMMFLSVAVVFIVLVAITRYVSSSSLIIITMFVVEVIYFGQTGGFNLAGTQLYEFYAITIALAVMAFWRHRANIKRLLNGTENRLDFKKISKKS
ncbi:MAG: glycerol-3-phosphate 1-O-acyltransferase PlsY [Tyzzerella sp.]|nr:glycerol-3-phosphate 1-O-acyltransferase PlsY [Tyzzerella sp.]